MSAPVIFTDEYQRRCIDCPVCRGAVQVVPYGTNLSAKCLSGRCDEGAILAALGVHGIAAVLAQLGDPSSNGSRRANGGPPGAEPGLRIVRASDVQVEQVRFLVPERVPLGAVTILCGDPGLGKSTWTCEIAAGTTTGRCGDPAPVLMANAEDGAAHVIVPRLAAAGADLERVELFTVPDEHGERPFTIPDDVPRLEAHAAEIGARLIVVDPLNAHLADGTNAHRDHSIRRALAPLAAMAQRLGAAVVAVVHLNKGATTDALYRVGGSIGLVGGARSVLLFARDPEDEEDGPRRCLGHVKSNWSQLAGTLVYEHEPAQVTVRGVTVETHRLAAIGESEIDGRGLLGASHDDPPATKRERAVELLADVLVDGDWHRMKEIETVAGRADISRRVLYRAADEVGVERDRRGFPAVSWWRLPVVPSALAQLSCQERGHNSESPATTGNEGTREPQLCPTPSAGTTADIARQNETRTRLHMAPHCACERHTPTIDDGELRCLNCGKVTSWKRAA